jgi:hypothetical protein
VAITGSASARISKGQGYQGFLKGAVLAKKGQFASYKETIHHSHNITFNPLALGFRDGGLLLSPKSECKEYW